MARAKIDYSTWASEALEKLRADLSEDMAPHANRSQVGHIATELARRARLAQRANYPADAKDWHLVAVWRPEHAGPRRKPNRVLSVLRNAFQVREGGKVIKDHLPAVLGYLSNAWRDELERRAGEAAARPRLLDVAMREEFQGWERVFAQRVADARVAGARSELAAARIVAARLEADIRSLLVKESCAVQPDAKAAALAASAVLDRHEADGFDLHGKLTRAVCDVTRQWRARKSGKGRRAVPVIRGRVRDEAEFRALLEVVRTAARMPATDAS